MINEIIDHFCSGSKIEFAKRVGISKQTLNNWLKRGVSKDAPYKIIEAFPDINPDWLLTGEGSMLKEDNSDKNISDSKAIPFYDAETTGGNHGLVSSSSSDVSLVGYIHSGGWFDGRETAAIRHVGDSMTEYPNGCILAVREVTKLHLLVPGKNYVIETDEYRVTKRVQRGSTSHSLALYSSNEEKYEDGRLIHEPFEVEFSDIRRIFSVLGYIVNQSGEYRLIKP